MTNPFDDDHDDDDQPFTPRQYHNDLNSRIMLTAIISLSGVVILVVALHIYARCVLRRQARRRAAIRELGLTVAHARSSEPPKTGLDPIAIAALPTFVYKRQDQEEAGDQGEASAVECAVCLSFLEDEEMARLLPNCKHTFHAECIDRWLSSHSTCPVCRAEAEPKATPEPEPREGPVGIVVNSDAPTAPPLDQMVSSSLMSCMEGTSEGGSQSLRKINGSNSRLSSFRRMLSRERSSRRIQPSGQEDEIQDLERQ